VSVTLFSSFTQDAVETESRPLVNVDVGGDTALSDCEVLAGRVDTDGSNAVGVVAVVSINLLSGKVVSLVLVTDDEDDHIVFKHVQVVSLVGTLAENTVEFGVSSRNSAVF